MNASVYFTTFMSVHCLIIWFTCMNNFHSFDCRSHICSTQWRVISTDPTKQQSSGVQEFHDVRTPLIHLFFHCWWQITDCSSPTLSLTAFLLRMILLGKSGCLQWVSFVDRTLVPTWPSFRTTNWLGMTKSRTNHRHVPTNSRCSTVRSRSNYWEMAILVCHSNSRMCTKPDIGE